MAYTLDFDISLGSSKAGLTLNAQIVDSAGASVGSAITTGFTEMGSGCYLLHCTTVPDEHRGGIKVYASGVPATILGFTAINTEEAEMISSLVTATNFSSNMAILATLATTVNLNLVKSKVDQILGMTEIDGTESYIRWQQRALEQGDDVILAALATVDSIVDAILVDTGTDIPATLATIAGYLDTEVAAILADTNELQTDLVNGGRLDLLIDAINAKTTNLPSDPADQSILLAAINAFAGIGAIAYTVTVNDGSSNPIDGVEVWITTDVAGVDIIAGTLTTDANGQVTFMLDAGT